MTKNPNNNESNNQVTNLNNGQQYLISRLNKILDHPIMSDMLADEMIKMIETWKDTAKERELKKIEEQIAQLEELKKSLQ